MGRQCHFDIFTTGCTRSWHLDCRSLHCGEITLQCTRLNHLIGRIMHWIKFCKRNHIYALFYSFIYLCIYLFIHLFIYLFCIPAKFSDLYMGNNMVTDKNQPRCVACWLTLLAARVRRASAKPHEWSVSKISRIRSKPSEEELLCQTVHVSIVLVIRKRP